MYTLRKPQQEAVDAGLNYLTDSKNKKNGIIVAPTAGGKSLIVANIAKELDGDVLVLQPSRELLSQNYQKFISYGEKASIYSASLKSKEVGKVTFATIGSIYKKPELFQSVKYCLVDESHLMSVKDEGMHKQFFKELGIKNIAGLSATPFKLKSYNFPEPHSKLCMLNRMRPKVFHDFIHVTQIQEMIDNDWWSPIEYITSDFDRSKLILNSTGANYTDRSIIQSVQNQNLPLQAVKTVRELLKQGRKQILVFAPDISTSEWIAAKLGCNSITSDTKAKDRTKYLGEFENQKDNILCNSNVLSVGYDNQKIDAIVDLYPTMSLARFYQRVGRGVRIDMSPNLTKKDCIYVDMVGNSDMFGKVEDLRIENIGGWGVFSGNKQLTNVELNKGVEIPELDDLEINVGKYSGTKYKKVPKWYMKYIFENWDRNQYTESLFKYISIVYNDFK